MGSKDIRKEVKKKPKKKVDAVKAKPSIGPRPEEQK